MTSEMGVLEMASVAPETKEALSCPEDLKNPGKAQTLLM